MINISGNYYREEETLSLYIKYDYLKTSDVVLILKSLEGLYTDILKSIGRYNLTINGERYNFILTLDEIHTGSSIDFKFGKKWIKTKKNKKDEKEIENNIEFSISLGLKEVIAFLLIIGVINSPNININSVPKIDRNKFEIIQDTIVTNNIWQQLQNIPQETFIGIEKKAKDLTYFFLQNSKFKDVLVDGISIKKSEEENF